MRLNHLILVWILCLVVISVCSAQTQSYCGRQELFFQQNASTTPAGYDELINYPSGNPQVDTNITITDGDGWVLIGTYILPEGSMVSTTELLRGLRQFHTYNYVSSSVGTTQVNFTAFQRFSNGSENSFYFIISDDINDLNPAEYTTTYASQQDLVLNPSDRLGIRVYGKTTHSAPITLHFVYQGSTNTSSFISGYFVCPPEPVSNCVAVNELPISPYIAIISACVAIGVIAYRKRE